MLLTQRTAEIKHRIPRREWSIIFKRQTIHYFYIFLHFCRPQIIQTSMMNGHLPSQCVTSNIPSSPSHSERVVTQISIHSGLNSSPFVHTYTNLPIHTTHLMLQLTPLGRISCGNLIMIKRKLISDYCANLIWFKTLITLNY